MKPAIYFIQIILGVVLILVILIQQKGSGMGSSFGGEMAMYRTKRGAEKLLFRISILVATLFVISSVAGLVA